MSDIPKLIQDMDACGSSAKGSLDAVVARVKGMQTVSSPAMLIWPTSSPQPKNKSLGYAQTSKRKRKRKQRPFASVKSLRANGIKSRRISSG